MNKATFFSISNDERVEVVNKLLETNSLKEVAHMVGIPYSTFTKHMRTGGYVYMQKAKCYRKVDQVAETPSDSRRKEKKLVDCDIELELAYIRENLDRLNQLVESDIEPLTLSKRIYSDNAVFSNKSIKMNESVYADFVRNCNDKFPHYRIQDLIAQSLLDFIEKYE